MLRPAALRSAATVIDTWSWTFLASTSWSASSPSARGPWREETLSEVQSLAYPFGYHNASVRSATVAAGYRAACEVGYGLHRGGHDPLRIHRLLVGPDVSGEGLVKLVTVGEPTVEEKARRYTRSIWRLVRRSRAVVRGSPRPKR